MQIFTTLFVLVIWVAAPLQAEMSFFWEDLRAASKSLSAQACNGVDRAYNSLVYRAETYGDPTAMNSLATLSVNSNCKDYFTGDQFRATDLICAAAKAGYPLAMSNCGVRRIISLGTDQDVAEGRFWIEAAMDNGYAPAGAFLARQYILGEHIPKSREEAGYWLERAEREGAPRDIIEAEWERFDAAFAAQQLTTDPTTNKRTTKEWLPPLSGSGFHRVEEMCVLKNDPITFVTPQSKGDTDAFIGITDPNFAFAGKVGTTLEGHELRIMLGTSLLGDIVVKGAPRVGAPDTLVLRVEAAELRELWREHDSSCAVDYARADIESGQYWLKDMKGTKKAWMGFGDLRFWKKTTWFDFRDCASIFLMSEQCK